MARIDAGAIATEARWAHPSEIIAAARDQVEHTLRQHKLEVHVEPDVPVRLDPRLTASALAHLLENAAQYAPSGSTINVRASLTDEGLAISVRDHGPGIAPTDLPHLFDRFYRGDAAKARASGTGMGLWIARGLLAAEQRPRVGGESSGRRRGVHDGDSGLGEGRRHRRVAGRQMTARSRILLVDDEVAIQRAVGPLLRSRGYEVDIAGTGADALRMVAEHRARSDRAGSGTAGSGRHGSLPARPSRVSSADRRALGARRRGGQGQRARSRRRRLRDQAVWSRGAAGAHSRGACAARRQKSRPTPASFRPAT